MLSLKTARELNWGELQYIENPMVAKTTVERNNGNSVNGEPIRNAKNYNLPDAFTRRINPYSEIHHKLENGQVFLVNTSTTNPLLKNLKISDKQTTQCAIMPGQTLMFKNAVDAMLSYVRVPQISGVVRQEPSGTVTVDEQPKDQPQKEKTKKKDEPSYKISIGVQGVQGVGSSDIRVCSKDFETPIKLKSVDKKYGKIEIDGAFKQNKGHREIALLDIDEGKYYSYLADHTGKGVIPLGEISTLEEDADANFNTALAAVVPMAYEDNSCNSTKPMPLKNGFLYVYVNGHIWREIKIDNFGKFKDVDLTKYIDKTGYRLADCHFDSVVLLPAKINGETPKVQMAFSQCQWTWQRIRQLGGMDSNDIRLYEYPDADLTAISGSDDRRKKRMGSEIDLSSWQDGMQSSSDDHVMAFDSFVSRVDSDLDDIFDERNENKGIAVSFVKESLMWANKAGLAYQLAWANFEEYLDDLKNPKHTEPEKLEEFKFSPYFDSAVLAHQYFFAENDDMKRALQSKSIKPNKRHRGPKRYKDADDLIQAIEMRSDWADKLSLPDIEKALGMKKRTALKDRILEEKKQLLDILNPKGNEQSDHFKEEVADFTMLEAREDVHQEWAYDQLWALVGRLLDKLARLPNLLDNGLDATPLTTEELNSAHVNDIGHQFVFSILDGQHWLHPIIFPKADSADMTQPFSEIKSDTDYTCDPNKLNPNIENDRDFEVMRRTSEFISGSLLAFMDTSADKIGDAHIQSTVRLIHSQKTGLKLQKANTTLGTFLLPELKAVGLELDIPELEGANHQIRVAFGESNSLARPEREFFRKTNLEKNSIDLPSSEKVAVAQIKNAKGNTIGAVGRDLIEKGHGLNPAAWQALSNSKWHTTSTDIWVLNDQQSLINQVDDMKPVIKKAILPMLALVELWNVSSAIKNFQQQKDIMNDPIVLANLVSAISDAAALTVDAVKIFEKYSHSKLAYGKGVRVWDKFLIKQIRYVSLAKWAGRLNAFAAGLSFILSIISIIENALEGDDAWVAHGVMAIGFGMLFYAAIATVGLTFMVLAFGAVLVGAALLKWVFKENDLMEQWLELGPFSKSGVTEKFNGSGGQMRREPSYTVSTDYGKLKLDKKKNLHSVIDMGDFYWQDKNLMLKKLAPLDLVDGMDTLEIGQLNGPVNLDALANKSQRLAVDEYQVVDDWREFPMYSAEDLASLIYQPNFNLEETDSGLEVNCDLNGIVSNQAKLQFQIWVREPKPEGHIGRYRPKLKKLDVPDEIIQLSGQSYKLIWIDFPVDQHSRYKLKYKVDLYGDNKITIPGRYDKDGWTEEWL